jgi:hypothetical protein
MRPLVGAGDGGLKIGLGVLFKTLEWLKKRVFVSS